MPSSDKDKYQSHRPKRSESYGSDEYERPRKSPRFSKDSRQHRPNPVDYTPKSSRDKNSMPRESNSDDRPRKSPRSSKYPTPPKSPQKESPYKSSRSQPTEPYKPNADEYEYRHKHPKPPPSPYREQKSDSRPVPNRDFLSSKNIYREFEDDRSGSNRLEDRTPAHHPTASNDNKRSYGQCSTSEPPRQTPHSYQRPTDPVREHRNTVMAMLDRDNIGLTGSSTPSFPYTGYEPATVRLLNAVWSRTPDVLIQIKTSRSVPEETVRIFQFMEAIQANVGCKRDKKGELFEVLVLPNQQDPRKPMFHRALLTRATTNVAREMLMDTKDCESIQNALRSLKKLSKGVFTMASVQKNSWWKAVFDEKGDFIGNARCTYFDDFQASGRVIDEV